MSADPAKFCKDCRHCEQPATMHSLCNHSSAASRNVVTGVPFQYFASTQRQSGSECDCGASARHWEPNL